MYFICFTVWIFQKRGVLRGLGGNESIRYDREIIKVIIKFFVEFETVQLNKSTWQEWQQNTLWGMQSRTSAYKIAFYTECEETLIPFFLAHLQRFPRKTHNTDVIGSLVSVVWNLSSNIYEGLVQQVHTLSSSTLTRIYSVFSNFLLFSLHSIAYRRDQLSLFSREHTVSILGILRHLESRM